jgi:ABC-2 type transport system ATP-binding protein
MEEMSRGMQQKVAIARALLSAPILLLLDEPTTGLDPRSKRDVQAFVRELRDDHDTTIVLTTHDMVEAEKLCDRIAIMDSGRIVALDTPENLKALASRSNGRQPTLEDVFLELTGKELIKETDLPI